MPRVKSTFDWDVRGFCYRRKGTGARVAQAEVAALFQVFLAAGERSAAAITDELLERRRTILAWQYDLTDEIRYAHTVAAVTASGGWEQMTPRDWGRLGALTRIEYARLNNFARQVETGEQAFNGHVRARARRYIRGARSTYFNTRHRLMVERHAAMPGVLLALREYGAGITGEKCDGCEREHKRGWQPAASVAYIGSQECGHNCNCFLRYRHVADLANAAVLIGSLDG